MHRAARNCYRWTAEEDAEICKGYPCYPLLMQRLPDRTLAALKHRARWLGVVATRHIWTSREVRDLTKIYSDHPSNGELTRLFPHLTLRQITRKAAHLGLQRRAKCLRMLGVPALDAIRQRASSVGLSLVELDRRARTGRYFQKSRRDPILKYIARAAMLLGGDIVITWDELE